MATAKEKAETMRMNCGALGMPTPDAYEDLRNATPEELLEARIWFTQQSIKVPWRLKRALLFLRIGFQLARPGGWKHVAPMWLRESRRLAALDG